MMLRELEREGGGRERGDEGGRDGGMEIGRKGGRERKKRKAERLKADRWLDSEEGREGEEEGGKRSR
jgi:hypothetical protein